MTLKVVILATDFLPVWGGAGSYVVELVRHLPKNVEITILAPFREKMGKFKISSGDYDVKGLLGDNVNVCYISKATDSFFYNAKFQLAVWRSLPKLLKGLKPDIIHSNSSLPDLFINPKKIGCPIVTTIHTTIEQQVETLEKGFWKLEFSEKMTKILAPPMIRLENWYYRRRNYFITVSEYGKRLVSGEKNIPEDRIRVIYNGVDYRKFSPENSKKAEELYPEIAEKEGVKVLYLSRMKASKGLYVLLEAIPKILKKVDAHFIFAGAGLKPDFEKYGLPKESYSYLGYVYSSDRVYPLADIFVLPSFLENFPISILEAMAFEKCVLATNVAGIPEMIESRYDGLLIPPKDVKSLSKALIYLIENDYERRRMAKNARKTVLEKFNWEKAATSTFKYYEEIIDINKQVSI